MKIFFLNHLTSLLLITTILSLNHCAQVVTGTAAKVVTVSKEDRSIGEFVDDTLIKAVIKNNYFDQNENLFFIRRFIFNKV